MLIKVQDNGLTQPSKDLIFAAGVFHQLFDNFGQARVHSMEFICNLINTSLVLVWLHPVELHFQI